MLNWYCYFCELQTIHISEIQIFNSNLHPEFGNLRTLTIDGEPWFVGKDVAEALGYSNTKKAILDHVDADDKTLIQRSQNVTFEIPNRGMTIINESGLYSLILSSKLESAKVFKHWVTSEVLPTIRKTGGYIREETFLEKTVRVFGTPEEPLFLARDVAEWIDYSKRPDGTYKVSVMLNPLDDDEKVKITTPTTNKDGVLQSNTEYWFLTENGLYEVLMLSRKPKAKQFKSKVSA